MRRLLILLALLIIAAPSHAQTIAQSGTMTPSGNTFAPTGGQTIAAGEAIVFGFNSTTSGINTGLTDSNGNTYTVISLGCLPHFASWCQYMAYGCNVSATPSNQPTFTSTWSSGSIGNIVSFAFITGAGVSCKDQQCTGSVADTGTAGTTNNGCPVTLGATLPNQVMISYMVDDTTNSPITVGSGWGRVVSSGFRIVDSLTVTAAGTYRDGWTYTSNNDDMVNGIISIKSSSQPASGKKLRLTQSARLRDHKGVREETPHGGAEGLRRGDARQRDAQQPQQGVLEVESHPQRVSQDAAWVN